MMSRLIFCQQKLHFLSGRRRKKSEKIKIISLKISTKCTIKSLLKKSLTLKSLTHLVKNLRADPLQDPIANLQLPTILPVLIASRNLHHPANPLYQIILKVSAFLNQSQLISRSPTEPYPSVQHVFGTICLNFALFLFLLHHCQSQTIICLRLLV